MIRSDLAVSARAQGVATTPQKGNTKRIDINQRAFLLGMVSFSNHPADLVGSQGNLDLQSVAGRLGY